MTFANFRDCGGATRLKMKLRNPEALQKLEDAEISISGGVWFRKDDFAGACDHLKDERPSGAGQFFKF